MFTFRLYFACHSCVSVNLPRKINEQAKMSRAMFYLFALSMTLAAVTSLKFRYHLPRVATSLHQQCKDKGYWGECWTFNRVNGWPHCKRTSCAKPTRGRSFREYKLRANAPDGLKCGDNKICYQGKCIVPDVSIPIQPFLSNVRLPITCYH